MHRGHEIIQGHLDRRTFLVAGGLGLAGPYPSNLLRARQPDSTRARHKPAKSTILIWLSGGASHIDTWDMKPDAPVEYRGEFKPVATSAPGVRLCEHLSMLARLGAGRDHWTHCMSVLFAGGGIQGGQTYGASDKVATFPKDRPVGPENIAKTVYHAMGIGDLEALDREGRPLNLMAEGAPLHELFGG